MRVSRSGGNIITGWLKAKSTARLTLISLVLFRLLSGTSQAGDEALTAGGHVRNFIILTEGEDSTAEAISLIRVNLAIEPSESVSGELAYEITPRLRERGGGLEYQGLPRPSAFSYRAFDLEETLYPDSPSGERFTVGQNLDRFLITLSSPSCDVYVGRQAVAFGSARVVNPTDVIAPFAYDTIAKEERTGVDALRVKIPTGEMGEVDGGLVFGEDFSVKESAAFIRSTSHVFEADVTASAMVFRENLLLGADISRAIGSAGAWIEAAYTFADGAAHYEPGGNYLRLSAGLEHIMTSKLHAYMEYHYNGAGSGRADDYQDNADETAYADGGVYLLGRHYIAPGLNYEATPLIKLRAQGILNLEDSSALASPGMEYNISEDAYLQLGAFVAVGKEAEDSLPHSEFGLYPDLYYASLSFYF
jgi:hypothetical protein